MNKDAVLHQLMAARASIDALISTFMVETSPGCTHPENQRLNLTTMGGPKQWTCKACGFTCDESAKEV